MSFTDLSRMSKYDGAATVALFNMLKSSQSSEVYRTLLGVLADYDPSISGNFQRTERYIHLLLSDIPLASCLLMTLPMERDSAIQGENNIPILPGHQPGHLPYSSATANNISSFPLTVHQHPAYTPTFPLPFPLSYSSSIFQNESAPYNSTLLPYLCPPSAPIHAIQQAQACQLNTAQSLQSNSTGFPRFQSNSSAFTSAQTAQSKIAISNAQSTSSQQTKSSSTVQSPLQGAHSTMSHYALSTSTMPYSKPSLKQQAESTGSPTAMPHGNQQPLVPSYTSRDRLASLLTAADCLESMASSSQVNTSIPPSPLVDSAVAFHQSSSLMSCACCPQMSRSWNEPPATQPMKVEKVESQDGKPGIVVPTPIYPLYGYQHPGLMSMYNPFIEDRNSYNPMQSKTETALDLSRSSGQVASLTQCNWNTDVPPLSSSNTQPKFSSKCGSKLKRKLTEAAVVKDKIEEKSIFPSKIQEVNCKKPSDENANNISQARFEELVLNSSVASHITSLQDLVANIGKKDEKKGDSWQQPSSSLSDKAAPTDVETKTTATRGITPLNKHNPQNEVSASLEPVTTLQKNTKAFPYCQQFSLPAVATKISLMNVNNIERSAIKLTPAPTQLLATPVGMTATQDNDNTLNTAHKSERSITSQLLTSNIPVRAFAIQPKVDVLTNRISVHDKALLNSIKQRLQSSTLQAGCQTKRTFSDSDISCLKQLPTQKKSRLSVELSALPTSRGLTMCMSNSGDSKTNTGMSSVNNSSQLQQQEQSKPNLLNKRCAISFLYVPQHGLTSVPTVATDATSKPAVSLSTSETTSRPAVQSASVSTSALPHTIFDCQDVPTSDDESEPDDDVFISEGKLT